MIPSRSVRPPSTQRTGWCRWHVPGGRSQPSASQPPASMVLAIRWVSVWNRVLRPRSRTWELPPRTAGMIPASQASRRAAPGEMVSPVSSWAAFEAAHQRLQGHGDHDGGGEPTGLREAVGGVALDVLDEGLAEPLRCRPAFTHRTERTLGGLVSGGGDRPQRLLQGGAGQGVQGEPAVDLAVAVVPQGQPGRGRGGAFLLLQQAGLVGVGGLGGDDLEDPPAQDTEGFGVVVGGEVEQPLSRLPRGSRPRGRRGARPARRRITSACSTWILPSASAVRVGSCWSRPWAVRIIRCAADRVVRVATACQFAVEDAAVLPAIWSRSAWARSRACSSATWAARALSSRRVAVVSVGSIDHTEASATEDSSERASATAELTRWGWFAIAVMGPFQHRPPTVEGPVNGCPQGIPKLFQAFFRAISRPPPDRSQPAGGNPIPSLPLARGGAVNPPQEPQRRHSA